MNTQYSQYHRGDDNGSTVEHQVFWAANASDTEECPIFSRVDTGGTVDHYVHTVNSISSFVVWGDDAN